MTAPAVVRVPASRWERWVANFGDRHPGTVLAVADGALHGAATDGSVFEARLPLDAPYAGSPDPAAFLAARALPERWGVLLVRKGGYAVARLTGETTVASKVGRRHVQGRTKAGGQSQQRFARRRANQAQAAYDAAAGHAADVWGSGRITVVLGGDRAAAAEVLEDRRLVVDVRGPFLDVPDPRRDVLVGAIADAVAVQVRVTNAPGT
ncbi:MAG TPA: acVLRF1 family peptidyl-tRNA hydrolase [Nocardioides sp.]